MSDQRVETSAGEPGGKPAAAAAPVRKRGRLRRTMLSTGFGDASSKTCEVCGFVGFRWQTKCPRGHPLA